MKAHLYTCTLSRRESRSIPWGGYGLGMVSLFRCGVKEIVCSYYGRGINEYTLGIYMHDLGVVVLSRHGIKVCTLGAYYLWWGSRSSVLLFYIC